MATGSDEVRKCAYMIPTRNRTCRMTANPGSVYCAEHLIHDKTSVVGRRRVPCPLDHTHTVFEDLLHKHLKKCNVSKCSLPTCHTPLINQGLRSDHTHDHTPVLSDCSPEYLEDLIRRVESAYQSHVISIEEEFLAHPCMSDDLIDPCNGPSALKHLRQQASILAHLEQCNLIHPKISAYVEFGAGRGKLTKHLHHAIQTTLPITVSGGLQYVLVDKNSCHRKVDGKYKSSELKGATCHRLLMDIVNLDLCRVEVLKGRGMVGISKHLCGAATDLALRCLVSTLHGPGVEDIAMATCFHGVAIAMCCHHQCNWPQFVGHIFMSDLGFTPGDFHVISHMTSWAVCGIRPPVDDKVGAETEEGGGAEKRKRRGYIPHPKEGVGLKCKRLLDMARFHYLQQNGMEPKLVYYVDRTTSLENVLLLATPKQSSQ